MEVDLESGVKWRRLGINANRTVDGIYFSKADCWICVFVNAEGAWLAWHQQILRIDPFVQVVIVEIPRGNGRFIVKSLTEGRTLLDRQFKISSVDLRLDPTWDASELVLQNFYFWLELNIRTRSSINDWREAIDSAKRRFMK